MEAATPIVVKVENPNKLYESLTAEKVRQDGTRVTWSIATKDNIIRYCARKGLSHGALDPRLVHALMLRLGWDTADEDDELYEKLLDKVMNLIRGNVNGTLLKPALLITKDSHGGNQAASTCSWATYVETWANQTDILHNHDNPAGPSAPITYLLPIKRPYMSYGTCAAQVIAMRKASRANSPSAAPATTLPNGSAPCTQADLAAANAALAKQQADLTNVQQKLGQRESWMESFLGLLASGLGQDKSSIVHLASGSPDSLSQMIVTSIHTERANALANKMAEDRLLADKIELAKTTEQLRRDLEQTRSQLAAAMAKLHGAPNGPVPQVNMPPAQYQAAQQQLASNSGPAAARFQSRNRRPQHELDTNSYSVPIGSDEIHFRLDQQKPMYNYTGHVNFASPPPLMNPHLCVQAAPSTLAHSNHLNAANGGQHNYGTPAPNGQSPYSNVIVASYGQTNHNHGQNNHAQTIHGQNNHGQNNHGTHPPVGPSYSSYGTSAGASQNNHGVSAPGGPTDHKINYGTYAGQNNHSTPSLPGSANHMNNYSTPAGVSQINHGASAHAGVPSSGPYFLNSPVLGPASPAMLPEHMTLPVF